MKKKRKKPTMLDAIEKISEVKIMRDNSGMANRDVVSISLKSGTESIDSLILKAIQAVEKPECYEKESKHQEWIQ